MKFILSVIKCNAIYNFCRFLSDCDILSNDVWDKFYYFSESLIYKSDIPNNCEIFTAASDICSRICVTCSSGMVIYIFKTICIKEREREVLEKLPPVRMVIRGVF